MIHYSLLEKLEDASSLSLPIMNHFIVHSRLFFVKAIILQKAKTACFGINSNNNRKINQNCATAPCYRSCRYSPTPKNPVNITINQWHRAKVSVFLDEALLPAGSTCCRKRRMNSSALTVMVFVCVMPAPLYRKITLPLSAERIRLLVMATR